MANTTHNILIIDDDPITLKLLNALITEEGYETIKASNGDEALALLGQHQVDAILSDVQMPEMNGYQLVVKVRENVATKDIPFVFISGLTTLEEMLQGYELGADEYIKKPIDPNEVVIKLNHIIKSKLKHSSLNQQLGETQKAAMQAMSYSSYLGHVLQFMQNSMACNSFKSLAEEVFSVMENLALESTIQFFTNDGIDSYTPGGQVSPLEINIIEMARKKGRFFDFEHRTLINHDEFSLLLKNMPLDNPEQYGLFKDILGNLCTAIEARVKFLLSQKVAEKRTQTMLSVNDIIYDVDETFSEIQKTNIEAIETMMADIEDAFLSLGLTENQEQSLRHIVTTCLSKTDVAFDKAHTLSDKFKSIHESLNKDIK